MVRVLLLGQSGQLASELRLTVPIPVELKVLSYADYCGLSDTKLYNLFLDFNPDWVINAVAYNQVEQAELFTELAMAGNVYLVKRLQKLCALSQSRLLHISTDYVFDGLGKIPYKEQHLPQPINQYGKSKVLAEQWLLQEFADSSVIIRTSWLYSYYGSNFVKTMLRLMQENAPLKVVSDQIGSPCWAYGLACTIWRMILENRVLSGLYHWADSGACSRYEFAVEIQSIALGLGLFNRKVEIEAVVSEQYSNAVKRPAFSVLDSTLLRETLSLPEAPWQQQLVQALSLFSPAQIEKKDE